MPKPAPKLKPASKREVIITLSITDEGCSYVVDAHNCEVPDKFPVKGTRELRKAKGIVSRVVYDFGFATMPTKEEA